MTTLSRWVRWDVRLLRAFWLVVGLWGWALFRLRPRRFDAPLLGGYYAAGGIPPKVRALAGAMLLALERRGQ